MNFETLLDTTTMPIMTKLISTHITQGLSQKVLKKVPACPGDPNSFVQFEQFWLRVGPNDIVEDKKYILTKSIKRQLQNLARIVLSNKYPVLLQGLFPESLSYGDHVLILVVRSYQFWKNQYGISYRQSNWTQICQN